MKTSLIYLLCDPDQDATRLDRLFEGSSVAAEGKVFDWPGFFEELVNAEGHTSGVGGETAEFCQLQAFALVPEAKREPGPLGADVGHRFCGNGSILPIRRFAFGLSIGSGETATLHMRVNFIV